MAGAALCEQPCAVAWQAQPFVNLHVQISWQARRFVNLDVQIARQAQYFVNLHVQMSWQAQHFVNLHASPNLDGEAPRNDGSETVLGHGRIMMSGIIGITWNHMASCDVWVLELVPQKNRSCVYQLAGKQPHRPPIAPRI